MVLFILHVKEYAILQNVIFKSQNLFLYSFHNYMFEIDFSNCKQPNQKFIFYIVEVIVEISTN